MHVQGSNVMGCTQRAAAAACVLRRGQQLLQEAAALTWLQGAGFAAAACVVRVKCVYNSVLVAAVSRPLLVL